MAHAKTSVNEGISCVFLHFAGLLDVSLRFNMLLDISQRCGGSMCFQELARLSIFFERGASRERHQEGHPCA